jgi:hypothetical protein
MLMMLRKMGMSSDLMYTMGAGSVGLSMAVWMLSRRFEAARLDRADRWGIFIGLWAPTFFAIGNGLRSEELWGTLVRHERFEEARGRAREAMPVP